ncbi:MAG: dCTP deaminase [Candidatus Altiarchaeota archaeon]|nr:dCTP deaminase [Candidatus Altiarchaeota archaeon]
MVLSGLSLKNAFGKSIKLKPFRDKNLSGVSYDITLDGEFLKLKDEEIALIDPSDIRLVGERTMARDFILQPGSFVLSKSEEWMELDGNIMSLVSGKSSLARIGLQVHSAAVLHPGHNGHIVLEIKNNNSVPVRLIKGMKIAQLIFFKTSDEVPKYSSLKSATFGTQKKIELPKKLGFSD